MKGIELDKGQVTYRIIEIVEEESEFKDEEDGEWKDTKDLRISMKRVGMDSSRTQLNIGHSDSASYSRSHMSLTNLMSAGKVTIGGQQPYVGMLVKLSVLSTSQDWMEDDE